MAGDPMLLTALTICVSSLLFWYMYTLNITLPVKTNAEKARRIRALVLSFGAWCCCCGSCCWGCATKEILEDDNKRRPWLNVGALNPSGESRDRIKLEFMGLKIRNIFPPAKTTHKKNKRERGKMFVLGNGTAGIFFES